MDAGLKRELEAKVYAGERLTREDGTALFESDDLAWLGRLAHHQRTEIAGDPVTFAVNGQSNLDNPLSPGGDQGEQWENWSRAHRLEHERGTKTVAVMHYGHDDAPGDRVDLLVRLRDLQDETSGFVAFVPLRANPGIAPAESLKTFAVSRLLLDNIAHLRSSLSSDGAPVTQLSLNFGADDIEAPDDVDREDLLTLVRDAGFRPVERDSSYAVVQEYDAAPSFADRRSEPQQVWA